MDYLDILKKAWNITWRYKALWVLGLFAGAAGGSSGGNSYRNSGSQQSGPVTEQFNAWVTQNLPLVIVISIVVFLIIILFAALSIAAQGGLIHGANEAAEGREPSLKASWGVGFEHWGRTFMVSFVLGLPVFVLALVAGVLVFIMIGGGALLGGAGGDWSGAGGGAAAGALGGFCCLIPALLLLLVPLSVVLGILYPLALRYGVLQNVTFGQAIKRSWEDLRAKRGAFVLWLVMLIPGFIAGIVMLVVMMPFVIAAVAFATSESWVAAGILIVIAILVTMLPNAIYSTFSSSAWTVFFRRMTGMEPTPMAQGGYAPAAGGYVPPAPPTGYAPVPPAYAPQESPVYAPQEAPVVDAPSTPLPEAGTNPEEAPPL